jgi:hypothetical protein
VSFVWRNFWKVFSANHYGAVTNPLWRWMGSIAQDRNGDTALGYSASGPNDSPSVRYTGRTAGDPLGQMTQAEQVA